RGPRRIALACRNDVRSSSATRSIICRELASYPRPGAPSARTYSRGRLRSNQVSAASERCAPGTASTILPSQPDRRNLKPLRSFKGAPGSNAVRGAMMSILISRIWMAVIVVVMLVSSTALAEQIDNPAYTNWAKFKPGSVLKTNTESATAGQKLSVEMTTKLLEVTSDKVTDEVTTEATTGQIKLPIRVIKQDSPA